MAGKKSNIVVEIRWRGRDGEGVGGGVLMSPPSYQINAANYSNLESESPISQHEEKRAWKWGEGGGGGRRLRISPLPPYDRTPLGITTVDGL